jgi:hypothetical protein
MSISAKGRRPIQVDGIAYVWWVAPDDDMLAMTLSVVSDDKHFLVKYALEQSDLHRFVVVLGREFRDVADCGGRWRRFRCPRFGASDMVTPGDVAALVRWCKSGGDVPVEVDWRGINVASG